MVIRIQQCTTFLQLILVFLTEEKLITADEVCKLSPHSQCIAYDKTRCELDGISDTRYKLNILYQINDYLNYIIS